MSTSLVSNTNLELCVKSLKEGQNYGFDPSLNFYFYQEFVSLWCTRAYFESWVKLLGPHLSISQTLRDF